jgi:NAD(P)-dependent dehydrogenase (short-subunit alcohol dehydrogenase family)
MDGTNAVVTGASRGIGASVARRFAAEGANVTCCARSEDALSAVVAGIRDAGGAATAVPADVREVDDVTRLAERAAEGGPIDVVVANAAVSHGPPGERPLGDVPYEQFDDTIRTNLRGAFATVRETLPHLAADGRVLVPSGAVAREATAGMGAYAVSKAGVEGLARGFSADLDVPVGVVDPGYVATDLSGGKGRDPEDVAPMFVWAARDAAPDAVDGEVVDLRTWKRATRG